MRICAFTCVLVIAAVPAYAQEQTLAVDLIAGHPIYHEREREAGVSMALSLAPKQGHATNLTELCAKLRVAAGLGQETDDQLRLETIFVVPYKEMAVEGYYFPKDGTLGRSALVPGSRVARTILDDIVARAGIPPGILDQTNVEHEISCETDEPIWYVVWSDIRLIGNEEPDAVIERARDRFMAIHQSVVDYNAAGHQLQEAKQTAIGG